MKVRVVGLNYKTTPVATRERLAIADSRLPDALQALVGGYATEGVILSTCNRIEVYAAAPDARLRYFLTDFCGVRHDEVESHFYYYEHEAAARHLFRVATGLDSMVLGEPQILGQVRGAFELADQHRAIGPHLSFLFQAALRIGKRARSETDIGRHAVSVSYAAVELARKIFGALDRCRVLVVGAGDMGKLTAKTLVDHGVPEILVANRSFARAEQLAERFGGRAIAFADLPAALTTVDIVLTSTNATEHVISAEVVRQVMRERRHRPLFFVDIAVPRDVDPRVQAIDGVYLYNIDDLQLVCEANRRERQKEVSKVEAFVAAEVARFADWWQTREVLPTVIDLRSQAERIRQAELDRALRSLGPLEDRERETLDAMTRAIVNKLLHAPTVRLKQTTRGGRGDYVRVLRDLFGLDEALP